MFLKKNYVLGKFMFFMWSALFAYKLITSVQDKMIASPVGIEGDAPIFTRKIAI